MSASPQLGLCQRSGFKFKQSELVKEWTGLWVHPRFKDIRNPQDFLTAKPDNPAPRHSSPEPADTFRNSWDVTPEDL